MNYEKCLEIIVNSLEKIGIILEEDFLENDYNLQEYVQDSMQFINTIIQIEEDLDIELTDELISYHNMLSLHSYARTIYEVFFS